MRQAPGPSTRIDLTGAMFSMAAPSPAPVTIAPHLVGLIFCPPEETGSGVFEVVFRTEIGDPEAEERRRAPRPQRQPVHGGARQVHVSTRSRRARVRRVPADLRLLPRRPRPVAHRAVHAAAAGGLSPVARALRPTLGAHDPSHAVALRRARARRRRRARPATTTNSATTVPTVTTAPPATTPPTTAPAPTTTAAPEPTTPPSTAPATTEPPDTTDPDVELTESELADRELARTALIGLDDFPEDWVEDPIEDDEDDPDTAAFEDRVRRLPGTRPTTSASATSSKT